MWLDLLADQLEGLRDRDDSVDAGRNREGFDLVAASAADGRDDGALCSAGDVRLITRFADAFDDVLDFGFGGVVGHVDNHWCAPAFGWSRQKIKAAILRIAAWT